MTRNQLPWLGRRQSGLHSRLVARLLTPLMPLRIRLRSMDARGVELAALLTVLRRSNEPWSRVAMDVAAAGSAREFMVETTDSALFDVPDALHDEAVSDVQDWIGAGLEWVTILDADYPSRLREIREAPPFVFYRGQIKPAEEGLCIVGSRSASTQGVAFATEAAQHAVAHGLSVISGLAAGIDTAAHRGALDAGGRTVAVLGTGINVTYPAVNAPLQREIAQRGLVVSQFYPDAAPSKQSFPMRNAIMSGLGLATVVVEAGERSGARIQARLAGEHGRPVILTSSVVHSTQWGRDLAGQSHVHVVDNVEELATVVQSIREAPQRLDSALDALAMG